MPLEIFVAAQRLGQMFDFDAKYMLTAKAGTNVVLRFPEAQLMALVVVATKSLFPFDGIERRVQSATDLSALSLDWNAWSEMCGRHMAENDRHAQLTFERAFEFKEKDCLEATEGHARCLSWTGVSKNIATEENSARSRWQRCRSAKSSIQNVPNS